MPTDAQPLTDVFAVLRPDLGVEAVPVTPDVYERLDRDFDAFRGHVLVSAHRFSGDWPTWERHPAGDEVVVLTGGHATLLLQHADGVESCPLEQPGAWVRVPRNTWHTARIPASAEMLFITPGEGTENAATPGPAESTTP
ncbi:MAG: cupin domain-containing protein [Xanthomonadales bacterium]|nr:cupin domain-containing protein [Xanthomonadales bacterium]